MVGRFTIDAKDNSCVLRIAYCVFAYRRVYLFTCLLVYLSTDFQQTSGDRLGFADRARVTAGELIQKRHGQLALSVPVFDSSDKCNSRKASSMLMPSFLMPGAGVPQYGQMFHGSSIRRLHW